jgi:hypothetical protein
LARSRRQPHRRVTFKTGGDAVAAFLPVRLLPLGRRLIRMGSGDGLGFLFGVAIGGGFQSAFACGSAICSRRKVTGRKVYRVLPAKNPIKKPVIDFVVSLAYPTVFGALEKVIVPRDQSNTTARRPIRPFGHTTNDASSASSLSRARTSPPPAVRDIVYCSHTFSLCCTFWGLHTGPTIMRTLYAQRDGE